MIRGTHLSSVLQSFVYESPVVCQVIFRVLFLSGSCSCSNTCACLIWPTENVLVRAVSFWCSSKWGMCSPGIPIRHGQQRQPCLKLLIYRASLFSVSAQLMAVSTELPVLVKNNGCFIFHLPIIWPTFMMGEAGHQSILK